MERMNEPLSEAFALAGQAFTGARAGAVGESSADLLEQVAAAQRVINAVAAAQVVRIAQFACRGMARDSGSGAWAERDFGVGHVQEFAGAEVGPLLGLSPGSADRRAEVAAVLARKLPRTLAAMAAGVLDLWRASVIAEELRDASLEVCAAVEERIHPQVASDAPRAARARVRRALLRVDPDGLREKAAKARLERGVRQWASDLPGMTEWAVTLPAADAARCWAAVDALAHRRHQDDPEVTLAQCRADALVDLLLGQAEVSTTVTFLFPVHPDTGNPDTTDAEWAEAFAARAAEPGFGREDAEVVAFAAALAARDAREFDTDGWLARECGTDWAEVIDLHPARPGTHDAQSDADMNAEADEAVEATDHAGCAGSESAGEADEVTGPAGAGVVAGVDHGCTGAPDGSGYTRTGIASGIVHPADEHTPGAGPVTADTPAWLRVAPAGCAIPGIGIIPADVVADLATRFDTTIGRALLDPATGTVLETSSPAYRPPAKIAAMVRLRDGVCRFPACTRPARRCDIDHVIPWPNGPTAPHNLHCLCKHHHRAKHEAGWRLSMTPDGVCTWTSPLGQDYATHPVNHLHATA